VRAAIHVFTGFFVFGSLMVLFLWRTLSSEERETVRDVLIPAAMRRPRQAESPEVGGAALGITRTGSDK